MIVTCCLAATKKQNNSHFYNFSSIFLIPNSRMFMHRPLMASVPAMPFPIGRGWLTPPMPNAEASTFPTEVSIGHKSMRISISNVCLKIMAFTDMKAYKEIVPFEMAQIPNVLFCTGWTNHQIVLNSCKTDAERLFYILYAGRERLWKNN